MSIKNSATRLAAYAAGAAITIALAGAVVALPAQAAGLTASQVQSILSLLSSFGADQATINNVQSALNGQATTGTTTTTTGSCSYTFNTNLTVGSTGPDVMALQKFLNMNAATQVSLSGAGSPGMESSYFGPATKAALGKFQSEYGITPDAGYFGPITRAKVNSLCTSGSTTTTTTTTTTGTTSGTSAATVSAAAQPANAIAPLNAARVPFTAFTVTASNAGPVTLNSVSVTRQGPSLDTDFAGVTLVNASTGVQLGISRVLDSNHSATIGSSVVIPAGTSMTFWVVGNISATPGSGDVASFAVTAVNTDGTVTGALPITGASNTMNSNLTIGTATISSSSYDPSTSTSQPVGTTGYRFTGFRIQAGSAEDLTFKSVTWYQAGSASGVQNIMTVINGTSYPTTLDSTGRYYTTVFPTGIVIPKGSSVDVYVQGDLGSNTTANTTAQFDIYRNTDIYLVGNTYGFGITPTSGGAFGAQSGGVCTNTTNTCYIGVSTANPYIQGSAVTVTAGTFSTVQNASSVASQNIGVGVNNVPLGGFMTNLTGEAVTAQSVKIHFTTSADIAPLQNVSLVSSTGSVIAGPYNAVCTASETSGICTSNQQYVQFQGSINFPVGSNTYTVEGEVPSGTANGVTIVADTAPATDWTSVSGNVTGNNITLSVTDFPMNTMTVQAASLSVSNSSAISNQTVVAGAQNFTFAQVQLDASQSGEDIRLSSLPMTVTFGGTASAADLSNCQLFNGSTALDTGSRVVNATNITGGAATFQFDNSLTVPKGTIVTLSLQCNLSANAPVSSSYTWSVAASGITANGATSGSNATVYGANQQTLGSGTIGTAPTISTGTSSSGTLSLAVDSTSPSYNIAAGGTTGVTLGVFKLRATNENINLTKLGIKLANTGSPSDLSNVYLYNSSGTLLGTAAFTGGTTAATSTLTTPLTLQANVDTQITVKGDLAAIGTNMPGHEGDLVKVNPSSAEGIGLSSGKTIDTGNNGTTVSGITTYKTYPTVALGTLSSTGVAGDGQLIRFQVTANNAGSLGIGQFVFKIASSTGVTIGTPVLYAYTDPNYSQPAANTQSGVAVSATYTDPTTGGYATTTLSTPLEVPAGGSLYFLLKTPTVSYGGSSNTYSVSATLLGDSAVITPSTTNGTALETSTNFLWTPNATSTVTSFGANDWTNGNGIVGLPSIGITQNRQN
jgi:Putative peptidoglycan binding domain